MGWVICISSLLPCTQTLLFSTLALLVFKVWILSSSMKNFAYKKKIKWEILVLIISFNLIKKLVNTPWFFVIHPTLKQEVIIIH